MAVADICLGRIEGSSALVERIEQRMNDQRGLDVIARVLVYEGKQSGVDTFCPVTVQSSYSPDDLRALMGESLDNRARKAAVEEKIREAIAKLYPGEVPEFGAMIIRSPYGADE